MRIRLLCERPGVALRPGEIHDVEDGLALGLIRSGDAEAVAEAAPVEEAKAESPPASDENAVAEPAPESATVRHGRPRGRG